MSYGVDLKSALRIFYYLIYVDGIINDDEIVEFDDIVLNSVNTSDVDKIRQSTVDYCIKRIGDISDKQRLYDFVYGEVNNELNIYGRHVSWDHNMCKAGDTIVSPQWFIWNLLTLAVSDNEYLDNENRIIDMAVKKVGLDEDIYMQFDMLIRTAKDVFKELEWIKESDKSYNEIDIIVKELENKISIINKQSRILIEEEG